MISRGIRVLAGASPPRVRRSGPKMISNLSVFLCFLYVFAAHATSTVNDRPIIGVLTQEVNSTHAPEATSTMLASYVKFLESAGARVVPIWIRKPVSYYQDIMSKINGILFPGGEDFLMSDGYGRSGKIVFDIATKMNDEGDFFPLWGTCLGFEMLNYVAAKKLWMKACAAENLATNLDFVEGYKDSRLFKNLETNLGSSMKNENVVIHFHQWCLTPWNYTVSGLDKYFKVLALNQDSRNTAFVSVIEAFKYPFYGVSFHPEKVMFEWVVSKIKRNIPHNLNAIRTSQYFANFFVNEARKCNHRFPSKKAEDDVLMYNYNPLFTGKFLWSAMQTYFFTQ